MSDTSKHQISTQRKTKTRTTGSESAKQRRWKFMAKSTDIFARRGPPVHSSVGEEAAFNNTLTKQPENNDSVVGSSV